MPERNRRESRGEDRARDARQGLRDGDRRELRQERERQGSDRDDKGGRDHDQAFPARAVDEGAGRRLGHDPREPCHRHDDPDGRLVPVLNRQQVDGEVRAQSVAHVREKEVGGVEGASGTGFDGPHRGPLNTKNAPSAMNPKPRAWFKVSASFR